jgi:hypothetical protein
VNEESSSRGGHGDSGRPGRSTDGSHRSGGIASSSGEECGWSALPAATPTPAAVLPLEELSVSPLQDRHAAQGEATRREGGPDVQGGDDELSRALEGSPRGAEPPGTPAQPAPRLDTPEKVRKSEAATGDGAQFVLPLASAWQWVLSFDGSPARLEPPAELVDQVEGPAELPDPPDRLFGKQGSMDFWGGFEQRVLEYFDRAATAAKTAFGSRSKYTRSLRRKRHAFSTCGKFAEERQCGHCSKRSHRLIADCNLRLCPRCQRVRAVGKRRALRTCVEGLKARRAAHRRPDGQMESYRLRLVTVTARFDVDDPNEYTPERYARRLVAERAGLRRIWRDFLSVDSSGAKLPQAGLHWEAEVAFGGMLHLHAAYWGLYLEPERLELARDAYNDELRKYGFEGNIDVQVARFKRDGKSIDPYAEVCKYVTKASSPKRCAPGAGEARWMDPALAVVLEIAFFRKHLSGGWGSLRCINKMAEELEPTALPEGEKDERGCRGCGVVGELGKARYVPAGVVRLSSLDGVCKPFPEPLVRVEARRWARARARARDG